MSNFQQLTMLSNRLPFQLTVTKIANCQLFRQSSKKVDLSHLIPENELEEQLVTGWGPGGQAVNKTKNAVRLTHKPTGVSVKCQDTRITSENRRLARKYLAEKVDFHLNGENSQRAIKAQAEAEMKQLRKTQAKQRLELKSKFKEDNS